MKIREKEAVKEEGIFEVRKAENFLKLMINTKPSMHNNHKTSRRINTNKSTRRNIIFKLQKNEAKEKILKASRGKNL